MGTFDNTLLPQIEMLIEKQPIPTTDMERAKLVELVFPLLQALKEGGQRQYILKKLVERWGLQPPPGLLLFPPQGEE